MFFDEHGSFGRKKASDRFFIIDASASDIHGSLSLTLYCKAKDGSSRTLVWTNHRLTFYVAVPSRTDTQDLITALREHVKFDFKCKRTWRRPLMGLDVDDSGAPKKQLYLEMETTSLRERSILAWAFTGSFVEDAIDRGLLPCAPEVWHAKTCPIQHVFVEHQGRPGMWIEATVHQNEIRTVQFVDDDTPCPPLKIMSFDIETGFAVGALRPNAFPQPHAPDSRIIQIGMVTAVGSTVVDTTVVCLGDTECPDATVVCCDNEVELLETFARHVRDLDPDVVTGFNIDGFDWSVIATRLELAEVMQSLPSFNDCLCVWTWARDFMKRWPGDTDRDVLKTWIRREKQKDPHRDWNFRQGFSPDVVASRLALYATEEQLRAAYDYFHGLPRVQRAWNMGRGAANASLRLSTGKMGEEKAQLPLEGRLTLDMYTYVKEHYGGLKSFSLASVSQHFGLGDQGKIDLPYVKMFTLWCSECPRARGEIATYCARDCILPIQIIDKTTAVSAVLELSCVTGCVASDVLTRGQQVRVLAQIYRQCHERDMVVTIRKSEETESFQGATVQEPRTGFYQECIVYQGR